MIVDWPRRFVRALVLYPVLCDLPDLFRLRVLLPRGRKRLAILLLVLRVFFPRTVRALTGASNDEGTADHRMLFWNVVLNQDVAAAGLCLSALDAVVARPVLDMNILVAAQP
jgi:hypothetical protein